MSPFSSWPRGFTRTPSHAISFSIKDPLDEAMRTRFMCSVNNEAVLKALFKVKDVELTFAKAISVVVETEDAAKVAKETLYG